MPRKPRWEPILFDDHGQPLCDTEEEEQRILDDLYAAGPTPSDITIAVSTAVHDLTCSWDLDPTDNLTQLAIWITIAEDARRTVCDKLGSLTNYQQHPLDPSVWHNLADKTDSTISHLQTTYPPTQEPRF